MCRAKDRPGAGGPLSGNEKNSICSVDQPHTENYTMFFVEFKRFINL